MYINNDISKASNYRSQLNFDDWLKLNKKACITGVDTRTLTKNQRKRSIKCDDSLSEKNFKKVDKLLKNLKKLPKMNGQNLASLVSTNKRYYGMEMQTTKLI